MFFSRKILYLCICNEYSGMTLRDFLEALPREWISEDLMEALANKGVHLFPTMLVSLFGFFIS